MRLVTVIQRNIQKERNLLSYALFLYIPITDNKFIVTFILTKLAVLYNI